VERISGQRRDVVIAEVELHDVGQRVEVVADAADDVQAEVQRFQALEVTEGVGLDVLNSIVVHVDHLEAVEAAETVAAKATDSVPPTFGRRDSPM
jgi:cell division FtsZ-interacting protein ZapD